MSLAILLGAGASIDSGIDSTDTITDFLFAQNGATHRSDGSYLFDSTVPSTVFHEDYVPKIRILLNILRNKIDVYYAAVRKANYEDIYYALEQMASDYSGDFDNPSIRPLIREIESEIGEIFPKGLITFPSYPDPWQSGTTHPLSIGLDSMAMAVDEARKYIKSAVSHLLWKRSNSADLKPYQWILDALNDFRSLPLYTLNHDTLLEQVLQHSGIEYIDGFEGNISDFRTWRPEIFDHVSTVPFLLKLHGSINWRYARPIRVHSNNSIQNSIICIPASPPECPSWEAGNQADDLLFLAGVHNKLAAYTKPPYEDIRYQFYRKLKETSKLVVCGYSFGDKGVNTSLVNWMEHSPDRILAVIHPNTEFLFTREARGAISNKIDKWIKENRIRRVEKKMKDCSWEDVKKVLSER